MRIPTFLKIRPVSLTWPVRAALLFAAYFVIAKLGLRFATIGESISPVWPPTGFAIAALLLLGWRYWPAILAGAFLANATTHIPLLAAAAIGCGNAGEALVGAYLMRGHTKLEDPGAVRNLTLVAAPAGALVSATTGVAALAATGSLASLGGALPALALWWGGNVVGALIVVPLILTWSAPSPWFAGRRTQLEIVALVVGSVLLSFLLLGRLFPNSFLPPSSYPYLLFPLVIAAAVRGGPRGAALATLVVALIAVGLAAQGGGPFALRTLPATATLLLVYIAVLAMTGLVLGAESSHRRHAERALGDAHENLRAIVQSAPLAIYTLGPAGAVLTWNAAAERLYGWTAAEVLGRPLPTSPEGEQMILRNNVLGGHALTGIEVIRRCNQLGVVVDVAHGTFDLVKRAIATTSKPLVLSHTALSDRPYPWTRLITSDHARAIASTRGRHRSTNPCESRASSSSTARAASAPLPEMDLCGSVCSRTAPPSSTIAVSSHVTCTSSRLMMY